MRVMPLAGLVVCLAACSGGEPPGTGSRPSAAAPRRSAADDLGPPGGPHCRPPSPIRALPGASGGSLPEVQGTGLGIRLWGLIFAKSTVPPVRAGADVKIAWRITGSGPLRLSATGPDGRAHPLLWGPEEHGGSSYDRPGEEWGAGYRFTRPGCWRLRAVRGGATADVWIRVAAP